MLYILMKLISKKYPGSVLFFAENFLEQNLGFLVVLGKFLVEVDMRCTCYGAEQLGLLHVLDFDGKVLEQDEVVLNARSDIVEEFPQLFFYILNDKQRSLHGLGTRI